MQYDCFTESKDKYWTLFVPHVNVLQYILAAHTYTSIHTHKYTLPHSILVVWINQWILSDVCLVGWVGGCGSITDREAAAGAKVLMTMETAAMCTREVRKGSDTVIKVPVPLYQLNDGYCGPWGPSPLPVCTDITTPSSWVEEREWMTTVCTVVQRSLSSSLPRQLSPPPPCLQNHSSR